jgi:hydroxyacylglutathione hydrolase
MRGGRGASAPIISSQKFDFFFSLLVPSLLYLFITNNLAKGDRMQITPSIHALRHSFSIPIAPGVTLNRFVYSYLICSETITLIDAGVAGSETQIFDTIRSTGRDPSEVTLIILTHSHPDHIGAARTIQKATGCSIAAHPAERGWIEDVELQNRERPVPGFASLVSGSVQLDHELVDGDSIEPDETRAVEMQVLHTPGHSPGSISLLLQSEGALFSGDAIPVTGDLPVYDDALASVQSIRRLRGLAGIRVLLQAWDEPRAGDEVYGRMDRAVGYLQRIHEAVLAGTGTGPTDLMELSGKTAAVLGLPPQAVNSLLARTFAANLRVKDRNSLLEDPPR